MREFQVALETCAPFSVDLREMHALCSAALSAERFGPL